MSALHSRSDAALERALTTLGLNGPVEADALKVAFRAAVKAARPDQGGDAERFRRVIAAYRLLQAHGAPRLALSAPKVRPRPLPVVALTPLQAVHGAEIELRLGKRRLKVSAPAGLRTGEHLRLRGGGEDGSDLYLAVLIRPADGLSVMGDDLFMTAPAGLRVLADGGRLEIETHAGTRSAWVTPGLQSPVRLSLRGLGLPARGSRPAGRLIVTLSPCEDAPSAAGDLLERFTRVWTAERLAA
jgi:curved DNA-binding protein